MPIDKPVCDGPSQVVIDSIGELVDQGEVFITDIGDLQTDVGTNQTNIGTNQTDIGTNKTDITNLQTDVGTNQTDIGALQTSVTTLQNLWSSVPRGVEICIAGDSYVSFHQDSTTQSNTQNSNYAASVFSFVEANLGDSIKIVDFKGVSGDTASLMLARWNTDVIIPKRPVVMGSVGVNDFYGFSRTAVDVFDDVTNMITQCLNNQQLVLWLNCFTQDSTRGNFSTARSTELANYNLMLGEWAKDINGLILVDVATGSADHSDDTGGSSKDDWFIGNDKIHLSVFGVYQTDILIRQALAPYIVKGANRSGLSPLLLGDYGVQRFGNFTGTLGTQGAQCNPAAQVPDGWIIKVQSGEVTDEINGVTVDNEYELQLTKTLVGGSSVFRMQSNNMQSLFSGGENVESKLLLSMALGPLVLEEMRIYFYCENAVVDFYTTDWGRSVNLYTDEPMVIEDFLIKIAPSVLLPSPTVVTFFMDFRCKGVGTGSVILKNLRITDV